MDIYDIDGIIRHALQSGIDISPADRQEWRLFCCALKVLGYDETTFVMLSSGAEKNSSRAWREERSYTRYKSLDQAKGMIVNLARNAGINLKQFLLSPERKYDRRNRPALNPATKEVKMSTHSNQVYNIPMDAVRNSENHAEETALFAFLTREFGESRTRKVFALYHVGGSKHITPDGHRAAAFPYISTAQKVVDCKLFHIDPTTGSRKTAAPLRSWTDRDGNQQEFRSSWAIAEMNRDRRRRNLPDLNRAPWCNFGDHLLPERPAADVCLVESEKTALIAAMIYPERIWIAVGSKSNLTPERCKDYAGRTVIVYPDRDGYDDKPRKDGHGIEKGWRTRARELTAAGLRVKVDTTTERHYPRMSQDGTECHADIADLILAYRHGTAMPPPAPPRHQANPDQEAERIFSRIKEKNPVLAAAADNLELVAVKVIPNRPELLN